MCCPCCNNTFDAGCFDSCGLTLEAGIVGVGEAGIWQLKLGFGRRKIVFDVTFQEGDDLIFALDFINELYTYTAQIIKPDGTIYTFTIDNVEYDCVKFATQKGGNTIISI